MIIREDNLEFDFDDNHWKVFKFDDHPYYRDRMEKLDGTKAIDFLGIFDDQLFLIEVKDFRGHTPENRGRLLKGELPIEIAQKVRDSLACIVGAYRNPSHTGYWHPYAKLLCNPDKRVKVVVWLETDPPPSHPRSRQRLGASVSMNAFKRKLTWLDSRVLVCNINGGGLPDVEVRNFSTS